MNNLVGMIKRARYKSRVYLKFLKLSIVPRERQRIIDKFHTLYYDSSIVGRGWDNTFFLGIPTQKCPLDLFIYQEILFELKPDVIIETGTAFGGGALFLATICDALNHGKVITIDIADQGQPLHKRITYLIGSSVSDEIIEKIKQSIENKDKILVILDSDHSKKHVLKELMIYNKFVPKGSYLIVEDTNVNGHPVYSDHGPGPMEAVEEFLKDNSNFAIDKKREKFYLTFNPGGYLKRIY